MKKDKIMVFIPVYNCEKQITRVLSQINDDVLTYVDEIIVVNNLSTDNTVKVTQDYLLQHRELPCKIINNNANFNLGGSHKVAFNYALENDFDYVIVLHGDDQADIRDFLPILKKRSYKRADCVLGGRFESRSCLIGYSKKRILGNHVFNLIYSLAAGKSIRDMGSGLNMYSTNMLKSKFYIGLSDSLYFNAEMLLFSAYYNVDFKFYPITWREEDQVSNAKLFNLSYNLFVMALRYRLNKKKYIDSYCKKDIYIRERSFLIILLGENDEKFPFSNANGRQGTALFQ